MDTYWSEKAKYTVDKQLAIHEFARICMCSCDLFSQPVILHVHTLSPFVNLDPVRRIYNLLSRFHHPAISPFIEMFEQETFFACAFDYSPGLSLAQFLSTNTAFTEDQARDLFIQLLNVTEYLHEEGVAHRNLSADSVIIDEHFHLRIVGWSHVTEQHHLMERVRKESWTAFDAPEALLERPSVGIYYDCWSLGVLLYMMIAGGPPWSGLTPEEIHFEMISGEVKKLPEMSLAVHNLILNFLQMEPLRRYTPHMARSHIWLTAQARSPGGASAQRAGLIMRPLIVREKKAGSARTQPPSPVLEEKKEPATPRDTDSLPKKILRPSLLPRMPRHTLH
jgi:serine/threonine protein kinase